MIAYATRHSDKGIRKLLFRRAHDDYTTIQFEDMMSVAIISRSLEHVYNERTN